MITLALAPLRRRPAAFAGLAVALFLAIATLTMFGLLFATGLAAGEEARRAVAGPGLMVIAGAFGEIAVLVAFFVAVNALGFALRQQHRELALLRTVAATPRQTRRLVRGQVVATTLLVTAPAWAAGAAAARRFLSELQRRGMAAPGLRVPDTLLPMLIALAAALAVGLAATAVATRRISRIAPAAALIASATEHARTGVPRLLAGADALAGGGLLLRLAATRPVEEADKAGQAALLGSLVLLVAVALLGPLAARLLAAASGAPVATSPVPVTLRLDLGERPDPAVERAVYFCAAELLTNVARHSGARTAELEACAVGGRVRLTVRDDGRGGAALGAGTGLTGLAERLAAVDGALTVDSPSGGPTTVTAELPSSL